MERIEKAHNGIITEVFTSSDAYNKHEEECATYKAQFDALVAELLQKRDDWHLYGTFGSFCPNLQRVRVDYLDKNDWAHNIAENSVYIDFSIDFETGTFEARNCGGMSLTEHDRKKSFYCACSLKRAMQANGGRWMRKSKFKDIDDLAAKITKFAKYVHEQLDEITEGYPYKQMKINVY